MPTCSCSSTTTPAASRTSSGSWSRRSTGPPERSAWARGSCPGTARPSTSSTGRSTTTAWASSSATASRRAEVPVEDGAELLFACGGAMLIDRETYLNLGGLDDAFFAYFEDVDLGWRLWVTGFRVVLAADAIAYHRMHGTSSRFPLHQRYLLYERNALRMIIKNYGDENLEKVLAPALLLAVKRALLRGELPRSPYDIGGDTAVTEVVPRLALAHLHAIGDVVDDLDGVMEARALVQRARRRPDSEILPRFKRPMWPVMDDGDYVRVSEAVSACVRACGLRRGRRRIAGARRLQRRHRRADERAGDPSRRDGQGARLVGGRDAGGADQARGRDRRRHGRGVRRRGETCGCWPTRATSSCSRATPCTRCPRWRTPPPSSSPTSTTLGCSRTSSCTPVSAAATRVLRGDAAVLNTVLDECDFFVCASERQRDYWLGMLAGRHRLTQAQYATDPTLRHLIDVVPFGLPEREPLRRAPVLKGVVPGIGRDDLVVLWGGGSVGLVRPAQHDRGVAGRRGGGAEREAVVPRPAPHHRERRPHAGGADGGHRADELGLTGRSVFFGDWVPYDLREAYLLEADLGVTVARDLAETRLSFRTRVLDYLWAGLPVVTTDGDVLSDLVRNEGLGRVVPPGDRVALADAVVELLRSPVARSAMSHRARGVAGRFRWSRAVTPLRRVIAEPWRWEESRAYRPRAERVTEGLRSSYEEATHRRGQVVSGPRASVALDRAASQESIDRAMNFLLTSPGDGALALLDREGSPARSAAHGELRQGEGCWPDRESERSVSRTPVRVLVVTGEPLKAQLAGPAIRAWEMARLLAVESDVVLATLSPVCQRSMPGVEVVSVTDRDLRRLERWCDVIVFQGSLLEYHPWLNAVREGARRRRLRPVPPRGAGAAPRPGRGRAGARGRAQPTSCSTPSSRGATSSCAPRRSSATSGSVTSRRWVGSTRSPTTPTGRCGSLIAVAPFGVAAEPPVATGPALKGVVPGIGPDDKVVLWGGGVYNWFDPVTLVHAVAPARERHPDVRLFFMGMKHPNPEVFEMRAAVETRALADELGLTGTVVHLQRGLGSLRPAPGLPARVGRRRDAPITTTSRRRSRSAPASWTTSGPGCPSSRPVATAWPPWSRTKDLDGPSRSRTWQRWSRRSRSCCTTNRRAGAARAAVARVAPDLVWPRALAALTAFCASPSRAPDRGENVADRHPAPRGVLLSRATLREDLAKLRLHLAEGGAAHVLRRAARRARRIAAERRHASLTGRI